MGGQLIPHSQQFVFRSLLFQHFSCVVILRIIFLNNLSCFINQLTCFLQFAQIRILLALIEQGENALGITGVVWVEHFLL